MTQGINMANDQLQMRLHSPGPVTRAVDSRSADFKLLYRDLLNFVRNMLRTK